MISQVICRVEQIKVKVCKCLTKNRYKRIYKCYNKLRSKTNARGVRQLNCCYTESESRGEDLTRIAGFEYSMGSASHSSHSEFCCPLLTNA